MKCGKRPGAKTAGEPGFCPVAAEAGANSLNGGFNGGRICWIIAEDCCGHEIKCSDLHQKDSCFSCEFRYKVTQEEGLLNICEATGEYLSSSK